MGNINLLGSVIFTIISYIVLIEKSHLNLSVLHFYMFMIISSLVYLATQISGILFRNDNHHMSFTLDIFFSFFPLFVIAISFTHDISMKSYIADFRWVYLITALIDVIFFIPICYKFAQLRTNISQN